LGWNRSGFSETIPLMKSFLAILMLSLPGHMLFAADPAETWMAGYLYLQEGLAAEKGGDRADAITLLVRSLDCYRILAREHELFEPDRRNERILLIADLLESLGGNQFASFLPSPGVTRIVKKGTSLPVPQLPRNWSVAPNHTGTHVVVPLIETNETRRYHAMIQKLGSEIYPGYRMIPLVAE
jgi:hypothetical protein